MDEVLKDVGLPYAGTFPAGIAGVAAVLIFLAWLAWKAKDFEPPIRDIALVLLASASIVTLVQAPIAYDKAKSECQALWDQEKDQSIHFSYNVAHCNQPWPNGPDFGSGGG